MSIFLRSDNIAVDSYGIDPLLDIGFNAVNAVVRYSNYMVNSGEEGRPELISYKVYKTVDLWWVILSYNGITDVRFLTQGVTLRIPDLTELTLALNKGRTSLNSSISTSIII